MIIQYASGTFNRARRAASAGKAYSWMVGFAILMTLVLAALAPIMITDQAGSDRGNATRQILYIGVLLITLVGIRPTVDRNRVLVVPIGLLLALAWSAISESWSVAPDIGLRRLALTAMIMWTICASTRAAGYAATIGIARAVLPILLVANYATVYLRPDMGIHHFGDDQTEALIAGSWAGFMLHKNFVGPFCAVTVLIYLLDARSVNRYLRLAVILAAGYFLFRTNSRNSMASLGIATLVGISFRLYNPRYRSLAIIALAAGVTAALALAYVMVDPQSLGQSSSQLLTGRDQIWRIVVRYITDHGLLGAGYGSFWDAGPQSPSLTYARGWLLQVAEAHNGYLDLLGSIGLPGLLLVIAGAVVEPILRLLMSRVSNPNRGTLLIALLVFGIMHNNAESTLFDRDSGSWVFMLMAISLIVLQTPDVNWLNNDAAVRKAREGLFAIANQRSRRRRSIPAN